MRKIKYILVWSVSVTLMGCMDAAVDSETAAAPPPPASSEQPYNPGLEIGVVRVADRAFVVPTLRWTSPIVYVCWDNPSLLDATEREWVKDAISKTWQAHSKLDFRGWGACAQQAVGIRISIADRGPYTVGLGRRLDGIRGGMVLNVTFKTWGQECAISEASREQCIRSIAVHEFGHAVAIAHEQNRPDAPGECGLRKQGPNGTLMLTPYDPNSVMNYCNPVYNNAGVLSRYDVEAVQAMYGARI